jgi:hypothetical protein
MESNPLNRTGRTAQNLSGNNPNHLPANHSPDTSVLLVIHLCLCHPPRFSSQKLGNPAKNYNLGKNLVSRMRYGKCYSSLLLLFIASLAVSSCRKENGINNDKVIQTPYGVFFSERLGTLIKTNDGLGFKQLFPPDNVIDTAIVASGNNIIFIKKNLFVSVNNGLSWNPTNYNVNHAGKWQSIILDVPSHDRIYLASTKGNGVEFSDDHGVTWQEDIAWDAGISTTIQSFAQTSNKELFSMDFNGPRLFRRQNVTSTWSEITMAAPPPPGKLYLTNFNNTLIAADYKGSNVYYSTNGGNNWSPYSGLPGNQEILSCGAPLGQVLLAGTDSAGVWRLVGNQFVQSNNGLKPNTSVYGITGKQDIYKNGVIKRYAYIATNNGLYRSEDLGQNWVLVYPGDIRTIW